MNEEGSEESVSMCDGGGIMSFQRKMGLPDSIAKGLSPEEEREALLVLEEETQGTFSEHE